MKLKCDLCSQIVDEAYQPDDDIDSFVQKFHMIHDFLNPMCEGRLRIVGEDCDGRGAR